ncbi:MAG: ferritin family protein [Kiritimatiellae bacterium]|nr:ferritin family protein [Kiritimatiellia bacterium]
MPAFSDPFVGLTPDRKMNAREVTRALRLAVSAEEEAIHLYEAMADATTQPLAKLVLRDIANEERVHAGEFLRVLSLLLGDEDGYLAEGAAEVDALRATLDGDKPAAAMAAPSPPPVVGDLKEG